MNRIDRQNLAAMTSSLTHNEPMGLNTETGTPQTGGSQAFAQISDMSVPNGGRIIDPKPGSKFAAQDGASDQEALERADKTAPVVVYPDEPEAVLTPARNVKLGI